MEQQLTATMKSSEDDSDIIEEKEDSDNSNDEGERWNSVSSSYKKFPNNK